MQTTKIACFYGVQSFHLQQPTVQSYARRTANPVLAFQVVRFKSSQCSWRGGFRLWSGGKHRKCPHCHCS